MICHRSGRPSAPRLFGASEIHRMILLPVLLLLLVLSAPPGASAADLHALVVIDTGDKNIGDMVRRDMNLMEQELAQIASLTGMTLRKTVLEGQNFKLNRVAAAVEGLNVGRDDVIVFYYSGHGFRTDGKKYKWPFFYFHNNEPLDFAWVIQAVQAKGARLALLLTDACNNVVNARIVEPDQFRAKAPIRPDAYRALFLNTRGIVAATSSIPGETSTATPDGSLFTLSFLQALHEEGAKAQPAWKALMERGAGKKLFYNGKYKHTPYYEMSVTAAGATAGNGPGAQPVRPPMPPAPTVRPPSPTVQPPAAADTPVLKCKVPAGAGPASGEYARMPYWRNKSFKGLNYGKVRAATAAACHSACQQDKNCVSWLWLNHDKSCVFKHYCPAEAFGPDYRAVSGYSGREPLCKMGPGCGLESAAAAPTPAPAPQQPQPLGGGMPGWGGQAAPSAPAAPAQQGGGWQSIN